MELWVFAGLVAAAVLGGLAAALFIRTKGQADLRDARLSAERARC
jgi:hypothetical protein